MDDKILKAILKEEDRKIFQCIQNIIEEYDVKDENSSNTKLNDLDYFKDLQDSLPSQDQ